MPLEFGIEYSCNLYVNAYNDQMVAVHQLIQDKKLDSILEVRFEDYNENYDKTSRSIFEHLLGSDHPSIDALVNSARAFDIGRMPKSDVAEDSHISDDREKAEVGMQMVKMLEG